MGNRTVTTWTCDRCDEEVELALNEQPIGWGRVSLAKPPKSAESEDLGDLCNRCLRQFEQFMEPLPTMAEVTDA